MQAKLILIRHAQSAPNPEIHQDAWPLSDEGIRQSKQLAETLANHGICDAYSSPLERAVHTIRPLTEHLGLSTEIVPGLRERRLSEPGVPDWKEQLEKSWLDFELTLPGGESAAQCQERMVAAMTHIASRNVGKTVVVCSHGNAIALFLNSFNPDFGFAEWEVMRNPHVFQLSFANETWTLS